MSEILRVALSLSLSGALLIIIIAVCCRLLGERLSKRWQYYIWLVVVLRLLIPFTPEPGVIGAMFAPTAPAAVSYAGEAAPAWQDRVPHDGIPYNAAPPAAPSQFADTVPQGATPPLELLPDLLLFTWLLVAVVMLVRKITLYQSFAKYVRAGKTEVSDPAILNLFGDICEQAGVKRPIELYVNSLVSSPILMGFWRSSIVLPALPESKTELRHICLHELTHFKRGDIFYKWLLQIALCLHWFNPLVHRMVREANRACELSCDEMVIRALDQEERVQYGHTLLESLRTPGQYQEGIAALTLSENASRMKERLESMKAYNKAPKGRAVIAMAVTFGLLLTGWAVLGSYLPSGQSPASLVPASYDEVLPPEGDSYDDYEEDDYEPDDPEQDYIEEDEPEWNGIEQDDSEVADEPEPNTREPDEPEPNTREEYEQPPLEIAEHSPNWSESSRFAGGPHMFPQDDRFAIARVFELGGFTPSAMTLVNVQISVWPGGSGQTIMITDPAAMQAAWEILHRLEVGPPLMWDRITESGEVTSGYIRPEPSEQEVRVMFTFTEDFSFFWAMDVQMIGPVYILGHGPHTFVDGSSPQPFIDMYNQLTGR